MINRNDKGQFVKGHLLGVRFGNGQSLGDKSKYIKIGKTQKGKKISAETKEKQSIARKGVIPWNKGKEFIARKGKKSNLWKAGISQFNKTQRQLFMETIEYKNWRRLVFERDNFTCQICGEIGGKLRANHIKRYADYPELRTCLINGITICTRCDNKWVLQKERQWESYFNVVIGLSNTFDGYIVGMSI